jgi:hypothetical protein
MSRIVSRLFAAGLVLLYGLMAGSCGDGNGLAKSGTGTVAAASNVAAVVVDAGPANNSVNTLYTTVTVCVPGSTTECQTIDHIQVDTQSYGLRILASVLTLSLSVAPAPDGNSLLECAVFADGYSWGPVAMIDFTIAGEAASGLPIQLIGDSRFPTIPTACSGMGPTEEDTVAQFGANGILGIGVFEQDCGSGCTSAQGVYYSCTQASCTATTPTTQVLNPVPLFAKDNDGTILVLPAVSAAGAATVSGSLIFGIDTESNNASGTQTVLTLDQNGEITTTYNGASLNTSILDSGSSGIFFNDSSIPECSDVAGFYCPSSTLSLSAVLTGQNGVSYTESFSIANADSLSSANPTFTALPTLGGTFTSDATTFDWGLPFFYGRRFATAIENHTTAVATGPYMAF